MQAETIRLTHLTKYARIYDSPQATLCGTRRCEELSVPQQLQQVCLSQPSQVVESFMGMRSRHIGIENSTDLLVCCK
jgi:hypothetical protein